MRYFYLYVFIIALFFSTSYAQEEFTLVEKNYSSQVAGEDTSRTVYFKQLEFKFNGFISFSSNVNLSAGSVIFYYDLWNGTSWVAGDTIQFNRTVDLTTAWTSNIKILTSTHNSWILESYVDPSGTITTSAQLAKTAIRIRSKRITTTTGRVELAVILY